MGRGTSKAGGGGGSKPFQVITDAITFKDDGTLDSQVNKVAHNIAWRKNLTPDEVSGVSYYTGSGYHAINDGLRSKDGIKKGSYAEQAEKGLASAMSKATLDKPITVYRGSSADLLGGANTVAEIQKLVGGTVHDKGYVSTSVSKSGTFGGEVAYKIIVPAGSGHGAYVRKISGLKGEKEYLLNKGSTFRIVSVAQSHSMHKPVVTMQLEV